MEGFLGPTEIDMLAKLVVAMFFGLVIGLERIFAKKSAGMRTYAMVSTGAALFVIISQVVADKFLGITMFDPLRVASQIIVGIGFLGTGLIIHHGDRLTGLTTASGLWVAAGIGMAAGFGLFKLALLATVLVLFIFSVMWFIERGIRSKLGDIYKSNNKMTNDDN